jgi:hypothetical protein
MLHELIQPGKLESLFSPASGFLDLLERHFPFCVQHKKGIRPSFHIRSGEAHRTRFWREMTSGVF